MSLQLKDGITLYFARHGETEANRERRFSGRRDTPLTDTGRNQARAVGGILAREVGMRPQLAFISSPLRRACVTMEIVRETLGLKMEREYVTIGGLSSPWDWDIGRGDLTYYRNVAPYLGKALRENSGLRIFVGQGYYDMATPFFGAEYSLSRTGMPTDRITYAYYDAGHMMYVREADLVALSRDIRAFIRKR